MKMKRLISGIIALVLIMGMPVSAFAADWYLEEGDITVSADSSGQTVSQGGGAAVADNAPVVRHFRPSLASPANRRCWQVPAHLTKNDERRPILPLT